MKRILNTSGAVLLGLGSIIGTGIFVSIGLALGISGYLIIPAILIATFVALCNGLSSARLAAEHPVSGGTYEYGYRELNPAFGFTAGWMFLVAKSASAATAALGFAGYLNWIFDYSFPFLHVVIGLFTVLIITFLVAGGIARSDKANRLIVGFTLSSLFIFILFGIWFSESFSDFTKVSTYTTDLTKFGWTGIFHASAMMFVAFTGYGRVATLGEEVLDPAKTIPRAVVITLLTTMLIYLTVVLVALGLTDYETLAEATYETASPLYAAATFIPISTVSYIIIAGAATAMLGVLLNLVLGISRVLLAASRRGDVSSVMSKTNSKTGSPVKAVWVTGILISLIVLTGNVYLTWSFSAFTVLIYYSITNLSAIKLKSEKRKMPVLIPISGLIGCLGLAFFVDTTIWLTGLGCIAVGLIWHFSFRKLNPLNND